MQQVTSTATLPRREEWRAPAISAALLTFLALTPLLSHRTVRLASQGVLFAGMIFHLYKDGKRPFFVGKLLALRTRPTLYGTGASKPLDQITDAHGEPIGREPMEKLFTVSLKEVASRRSWCGLKQELPSLPTEPFKLPSSLISQDSFSFRYSGHLVQAVPNKDLKLLPGSKLPDRDDLPADWVFCSFGKRDLIISTDPNQWTLAKGWKLFLVDESGKLVATTEQTVPEFFRSYLTIGPEKRKPSIPTERHTLKPVSFPKFESELSLKRSQIEILQQGEKFYLLSANNGRPRCDILILGKEAPPSTKKVLPQDLRFSIDARETIVRVVNSRLVGSDELPPDWVFCSFNKSSLIISTDPNQWTLAKGWRRFSIGDKGKLTEATDQTVPEFFRSYLTIGSGERKPVIRTQEHTLDPVTFPNFRSEISLNRTQIEILQFERKLYLFSSNNGQPWCDIVTLGEGVPHRTKRVLPEHLRISTTESGTTISVVDCRSVKGRDGSSMIMSRKSWILTSDWRAFQIGGDGRLTPIAEQTLPSYFRQNPLILRHPTHQETISHQGVITIDLQDLQTVQIVAKGQDLSIACLSQGENSTAHRHILLGEGVTLENLRFTLNNGHILITSTN